MITNLLLPLLPFKKLLTSSSHSSNQEYADVPQSLPDWLVPESKAHLVQAARALSGTQPSFPSALGPPSPSDSDTSLSDSFDWYMSPSDLARYESIYTANKSPHGLINFTSLDPLYASLDVPETDVRSAWNLVNPTQEPAITKHATLAFLHVLNGRHNGIRLPRTVPASLRASFQDQKIDYNVERVSNPSRRGGPASYDENTSTGRKTKFGEAYLSRLGVGGKSSYSPSGTDFSTVRMSDDWETVRLQRELKDLEAKISTIESGKRNRGSNGKESGGQGIVGVEEEVKAVKRLVEGLEKQWRSKEDILEGLRREIDDERRKGVR